MLNALRKKKATPPPPPKPPKGPPEVGKILQENGILYLTGAFNEENILPLVKAITEYNLMDEEDQPDGISLFINSGGGAVHWCWMLVETMRMSDIPVTTIGQGIVASCGVLTLMAGHHRVITKNTSVMSHTYAWGSAGKEGELKAITKEFDMASDRMIDHYKKFTKKSETYIRKHLLHPNDEWMSPEECLKHKIIDEVYDAYE